MKTILGLVALLWVLFLAAPAPAAPVFQRVKVREDAAKSEVKVLQATLTTATNEIARLDREVKEAKEKQAVLEAEVEKLKKK